MLNRILGLLVIMLSAFVISYLTSAAFNKLGFDTGSLLTSVFVIIITIVVLFVLMGAYITIRGREN